MLRQIKVRNFQSHEDTKIDLSPGITAITGSSCSGKSTLVRAIKWVAENRPSGMAFQSNFAEKAKTVVELDFDEGKIKRLRTKSTNSYSAGSSKFDVVRMDVPDEVTKLMNFSDLTIQSQHDPYFLLQDSGGEVAKKLNKVANLEIIDFVMKEVNSDALQIAREKRQNTETITKLKTDLNKYIGLDEVKIKADSLEKKINTKTTIKAKKKQLTELMKSITETEEDIEDVVDWLSVEEPFEVLQQKVIDKADIENSRDRLKRMMEEMFTITKSIAECDKLLSITKTVTDLLEQINSFREYVKIKHNLSQHIKSMEALSNIVSQYVKQITYLENEATRKMIENKKCPLCEHPLSQKYVKQIVGGWQ